MQIEGGLRGTTLSYQQPVVSSDTTEFDALDPARLRELFDLRSNVYASRGGAFEDDPYPAFHRLRETGPVHEGIVGPLVGFDGEAFFQGLPFPDRPHFSAFDFATCDQIFRDGDTYISKPPDGGSINASILFMDGAEHRRYRALVQPSFLPKRARWWIENWIDKTVDALIDRFEPNGRADLNVEFFSAIPLLTISGSFGISVAEALDIAPRSPRTVSDSASSCGSCHRSSKRGATRRVTTSSASWSKPRSPTNRA